MIKKERINVFGVGKSHKNNKHGGIPIGGRNRAEEGESSVDFKEGKYIFSDRLFIDEDMNLPMDLPKGITYAKATKIVKDKFNTGNKVDKDTELEVLTALRSAQEVSRAKIRNTTTNQFALGGSVEASDFSADDQQNMIEGQEIIDKKAQNTQNVSTGLTTAGLAAQAIPGVGTVIGGVLAAAGGIVGAVGSSNQKKRTSQLQKESIASKAEENKVFALGGPVNDTPNYIQPEIQSDILGINAIGNAFLTPESVSPVIDKTATSDSLPVKKFTLNQTQLDNTPFNLNIQSPRAEALNLHSEKAGGDIPARTDIVTTPTQGSIPITKDKNGIIQSLRDNIGDLGTIGLGAQFATGLAQNIVGLASTKKPAPENKFPVGSPRTARKISLEEVRKAVRRNTQSSIQALAARSDGDFGKFASNVANVTGKATAATSDSVIKEQQLNNEEEYKTDVFNLRQDNLTKRNAQIAADLNAQNLGVYNTQRRADMDALFANAASISKSVQNIGMGDMTLEELMKLAKTKGLNEENV